MWFSRLGGEKSREGERRYACLISDLIVRKRVKETLGERERGEMEFYGKSKFDMAGFGEDKKKISQLHLLVYIID